MNKAEGRYVGFRDSPDQRFGGDSTVAGCITGWGGCGCGIGILGTS
jgi:hypothetical protein